MPIYDPGDTVPVRDVDPNEDHPLEAITYAEEHNLGPNQTIIDTFTPAEKTKLLKMIKNGEFSALEGAVIKAIMSEQLTLEELGAMMGAQSRRTKGAPLSKPGTLKELNRILDIIAKRSKAITGKQVDLKMIPKYKAAMKKNYEFRKKKAKKAQVYANKQEQEFRKLLRELHAEQDKLGLPRTEWYIRKFAPADKDISKMKQFGGTPDSYDD